MLQKLHGSLEAMATGEDGKYQGMWEPYSAWDYVSAASYTLRAVQCVILNTTRAHTYKGETRGGWPQHNPPLFF